MTTYDVTETLPDGRVRIVAENLTTLQDALRVYAGVRWAGTIVRR